MSDQDPSNADQAPLVENAPSSPSAEASSASTDAAAAETSSEPTDKPAAEASSEPTDKPAAAVIAGAGKADLRKRALALLIDMVLAFIVGFVPAIGGLVGAVYLLLRDGMDLDFMNHRSIGKQVMKLRLDSLTNAPIDPLTSMKRNWLLAFAPLAQAGLFIPIVGWLFTILITPIAFIALVVEVVLVLTDSEGRRLGDRIAGTVVRED